MFLCAQQDLQQPGLPRYSSVPACINTQLQARGHAPSTQAPALLRLSNGGSTGQIVPAGRQLPLRGVFLFVFVEAGLRGCMNSRACTLKLEPLAELCCVMLCVPRGVPRPCFCRGALPLPLIQVPPSTPFEVYDPHLDCWFSAASPLPGAVSLSKHALVANQQEGLIITLGGCITRSAAGRGGGGWCEQAQAHGCVC